MSGFSLANIRLNPTIDVDMLLEVGTQNSKGQWLSTRWDHLEGWWPKDKYLAVIAGTFSTSLCSD